MFYFNRKEAAEYDVRDRESLVSVRHLGRRASLRLGLTVPNLFIGLDKCLYEMKYVYIRIFSVMMLSME